MAYLFGVAVECGQVKEQADLMLEHFRNFHTLLSNGQTVTYSCRLHEEARQDDDKPNLWVFVFVNEFKSGAATREIADLLSEAGQFLHKRLQTAPPFRFAVTGVEPLEAISYEELSEFLLEPGILQTNYPGLIISDQAVPENINGDALKPFAPGYLWVPYRGEKCM